MRIDRLEIENFKKFSKLSIDLHPQFTLLAGENGSGKTTILDALAVAAGIWLVEPPDSTLAGSRREILPTEIRLESEVVGDRTLFRERRPVVVRAIGSIIAGLDEFNCTWTRQIRENGRRTTNAGAKEALEKIRQVYRFDATPGRVNCPLVCYYGAGRAWLPSHKRSRASTKNGPARRWAAFYDCFNERIRFDELHKWFRGESIERGNRQGAWRPGFHAVRHAVLDCVPGAADISYDADSDQVMLSIDGQWLPFDNLSAGQRMMLALVADLAIKSVTQNAHMITDDPASALPVLERTRGIVLIDEIDVHLHPAWQRRVAHDLKRIFPGIQFVCTSHSPQVIGELKPEEIRLLHGDSVWTPPRSFGMDSNRVLAELMDARPRNAEVEGELRRLFELIDREQYRDAHDAIERAEAVVGRDESELTRAKAMLHVLEEE